MFEVGVCEMEDALPAKFQTSSHVCARRSPLYPLYPLYALYPLYPLYVFAERGEVK